jgi:heavy metal translocating P-type ATPase
VTQRLHTIAAALALGAIAVHLVLRFALGLHGLQASAPLVAVLAVCGIPLVIDLVRRAFRGEFGSDHLAGISIIASSLLGEYLAGVIVVLMLAGGNVLEQLAAAKAASALRALASRVPTIAHRRRGKAALTPAEKDADDIPVAQVAIGDELSVLPHEICPVDGDVIEGHGSMDESYLTGEPFTMSKGPGSPVLSGAVNGDSRLVIRTTRAAVDSRFARIMRVMQEAEQHRPNLRRIGDRLGAWYTPLALALAAAAWYWSGQPVRFLSVVVVATPCPLIIAIPVSIIGAISAAARRGIIIRDPAALEQLTECRTMILDKTGTLTYGRPALSGEDYAPSFTRDTVLPLVSALERLSRHPLAGAIVRAADEARYPPLEAAWIREQPGAGLEGSVGGAIVRITSRARAAQTLDVPPGEPTGLECIVIVNDRYAATYRFHDLPRPESRSFILHLGPNHGFTRALIVSGDRESEVRRLASSVAITEVHAATSPEEKVEIVRRETARSKTLFIGDGINDAPALATATVGVAFGQKSDVTSEAARVVVIDTSLLKVDELIHISRRLRRIALQSALGGMALSIAGMALAAAGHLSPVAGAVAQEGIDLLAVLNALRMVRVPSKLTDFS